MRAVHKLSRCPIRITFYCAQCAELNDDVIGEATAYELNFYKYYVLRSGIVVSVQETRPRATAVASVLMYHDFCLHINPKKMMSYFLKDLHVFSCIF